LVFETGPCCVAQADLELSASWVLELQLCSTASGSGIYLFSFKENLLSFTSFPSLSLVYIFYFKNKNK
jgi:hypothetical protein